MPLIILPNITDILSNVTDILLNISDIWMGDITILFKFVLVDS